MVSDKTHKWASYGGALGAVFGLGIGAIVPIYLGWNTADFVCDYLKIGNFMEYGFKFLGAGAGSIFSDFGKNIGCVSGMYLGGAVFGGINAGYEGLEKLIIKQDSLKKDIRK